MSAKPRQAAAVELGRWLDGLRWQFFVTLTFPYEVSTNRARMILAAFIDQLERGSRGSIAYAGALETEHYSGCEMSPVRPHFHLLMSSERGLDAAFIRKGWTTLVGRGQNRSALGGPMQDSADVRPFRAGRGGAEYCVKVTKDTGDWVEHNLEFVSPEPVSHGRAARRLRRSVRRCSGK